MKKLRECRLIQIVLSEKFSIQAILWPIVAHLMKFLSAHIVFSSTNFLYHAVFRRNVNDKADRKIASTIVEPATASRPDAKASLACS